MHLAGPYFSSPCPRRRRLHDRLLHFEVSSRALTGILPLEPAVQNSVFLVPHFHNVIIGGIVFGLDKLDRLAAQGVPLQQGR